MAKSKKKSVKNHRQTNNKQPVKKQLDKYNEPIATKDMIIITIAISILILCVFTFKLVEYENTYYFCVRSFIQPNAGSTVLFEHVHETREYLIETKFDPELERDACMHIWGISLFSFGE